MCQTDIGSRQVVKGKLVRITRCAAWLKVLLSWVCRSNTGCSRNKDFVPLNVWILEMIVGTHHSYIFCTWTSTYEFPFPGFPLRALRSTLERFHWELRSFDFLGPADFVFFSQPTPTASRRHPKSGACERDTPAISKWPSLQSWVIGTASLATTTSWPIYPTLISLVTTVLKLPCVLWDFRGCLKKVNIRCVTYRHPVCFHHNLEAWRQHDIKGLFTFPFLMNTVNKFGMWTKPNPLNRIT